MLNISHNSIKHLDDFDKYNTFIELKKKIKRNTLLKVIYASLFLFIIILFLPWTQNIRSTGGVTALKPNQRPQTIHSIIAGRIEKWYVQEGQFVKQGDTIIRISEVKEEYLDPNLVERTQEQLKAKEFTVKSYMDKVRANDNQIDALINVQKLKLEQAANKLQQASLKVQSDSVDLIAAKLNMKIAQEQLNRMQELYDKGLKSLTELETRKLKLQETQAKLISQENDLLTSRNELINAKIEIKSISADYSDKIAKSEAEKFSTLSNMYDAEATVTKLQNQVSNYVIRSNMYFILAPQDGYITQAIKSGVGETLKEGAEIISIMPANFDLAVEMYVYPMDMPLLEKNQKVRILFDGWPSIVFSGWPGITYGTYGGKIVAIDNFLSGNGKYRILVAPDENEAKWPSEIRIGAGANTITLLKDVPVWYEMWRKINGFPPDYYKKKESNIIRPNKESKNEK